MQFGLRLTIVPLLSVVTHLCHYECIHASTSTTSASLTTFSSPSDDYGDISFDFSSYTFSEYPDCWDAGGWVPYISDGDCDLFNSLEECGYDGGDCCSCTCVDGEYICGEAGGYFCQDPSVSTECMEESDSYITSSPSTDDSFYNQYPDCDRVGGTSPYIADGDCDRSNSNEECAYDGGDCCSCTCVDTAAYTCGVNGGYFCLDPSVSTECIEESASYIPPSSSTTWYLYNEYPDCAQAGGYIRDIGNGYCDTENSIEECAYDSGDCCLCTCVDTGDGTCGEHGYFCQDPSVSTDCKEESDSYVPVSSSSS